MLHLVFKVSSTCSHTRLKSLSPLSNCFINSDSQACPIPQQSGVVARRHPYCLSYKPVLAVCPRSCSHWVEIGAVGWPQIWWNEGWRLDFQEFDSFVSPMRWGSVLLKCEVIRVLRNIGQKISHKQYVLIILTIHFNAGINDAGLLRNGTSLTSAIDKAVGEWRYMQLQTTSSESRCKY